MRSLVQLNARVARTLSIFRSMAVVLALLISVPAAAQFSDNFTRADSDAVGNGWIEKHPDLFSIAANRAQKNARSSSYLDNVLYRPAAENVLDVEATAEIRFS